MPRLPINELLCGDSSVLLQGFPSDSLDLIATDPPYGLKFMGKDWDKAVPSVGIWKECLRVLKPGAFAFIMSSPRLDCLGEMSRRLQETGFEIGFTPIYWAYASGFPKAENISKMVDKRLRVERKVMGQGRGGSAFKIGGTNPRPWHKRQTERGGVYDITTATSDEAKVLDGSYAGFQPKPAVEVIIVAMKPLSERTYVDQTLKNKKGVTWLDDGRIPFQDDADAEEAHDNSLGPVDRGKTEKRIYEGGKSTIHVDTFSEKGRFPANLLVSDDALGAVLTGAGGSIRDAPTRENRVYGQDKRPRGDWDSYGDSGSFSRYFDLDRWFEERLKRLPESVQRTFPFLIVPKASKTERDEGCQDLDKKRCGMMEDDNYPIKTGSGNLRDTRRRNIHPTVKPLKLVSYLVTLGSREGEIVLDPFAGSGTTCIAAHILNRKWIGIEIEPEYMKIAEARLKPYITQQKLI